MAIRIAKWAAICGAAVAALLTATSLFLAAVNGDPFLLHIRPTESGATVQFRQPSQALVSPVFQVSTAISQETQVQLVSGDVLIPGGNIEFYDTTLLPGRFRIQMGDSEFDVMQVTILVDGESHAWIPEHKGPGDR